MELYTRTLLPARSVLQHTELYNERINLCSLHLTVFNHAGRRRTCHCPHGTLRYGDRLAKQWCHCQRMLILQHVANHDLHSNTSNEMAWLTYFEVEMPTRENPNQYACLSLETHTRMHLWTFGPLEAPLDMIGDRYFMHWYSPCTIQQLGRLTKLTTTWEQDLALSDFSGGFYTVTISLFHLMPHIQTYTLILGCWLQPRRERRKRKRRMTKLSGDQTPKFFVWKSIAQTTAPYTHTHPCMHASMCR